MWNVKFSEHDWKFDYSFDWKFSSAYLHKHNSEASVPFSSSSSLTAKRLLNYEPATTTTDESFFLIIYYGWQCKMRFNFLYLQPKYLHDLNETSIYSKYLVVIRESSNLVRVMVDV